MPSHKLGLSILMSFNIFAKFLFVLKLHLIINNKFIWFSCCYTKYSKNSNTHTETNQSSLTPIKKESIKSIMTKKQFCWNLALILSLGLNSTSNVKEILFDSLVLSYDDNNPFVVEKNCKSLFNRCVVLKRRINKVDFLLKS